MARALVIIFELQLKSVIGLQFLNNELVWLVQYSDPHLWI